MEDEDVAERGRLLRHYAEHFAPRDWEWTRAHGVEAIHYPYKRYQSRADGSWHRDWDHPLVRVPRVLRDLLPRPLRRTAGPVMEDLRAGIPWRAQARWAWRRGLRRDTHLPDGALDNGGILVHWEETGEYIQLVEPSVGSLVADLLEQDPGNPHARAIAAELRRIADGYSARIAAKGGRTV